MHFFIRLLIFVAVGILLGKIYNKFVIKNISDNNKRKMLCILTMVIFLCSAVSVSVAVNVNSFINATINNYSVRIEQFVNNIYPKNDFLANGIDLNKIGNNILEINKAVTDLKAMMPTHVDLRFNERIYNMIVGSPMDGLLNQLNDISLSGDNLASFVSTFADGNNFITVSSILNYLTRLAIMHINVVFLWIIVLLLIPFCIYVALTSIIVFGVVKKRK